MTEEELLKIKVHIEIHSRREPPARKITKILWKAVGELEHISEIKEQLEAAKQERTEALYRNDKLINEIKKFKADYKELCNLKNMRIAELENEKCELLGIIQGKDEAIKNLTQNLEDTEIINKTLGKRCNQLLADKGKLIDENAELKKELDEIDKAGEHVRQQINDAFRNKKPYWELEKENAELKNRNQELLESCEGTTMMYKDLTKAKELLKKAIRCTWSIDYFVVDEIKEFLKGVK